ncbi:MAG TPA: SRPBCC family protein [Verrucomicrobiae bacterium]|nr:SRPBCC family protein [Verrucomicrobiae bacterium]
MIIKILIGLIVLLLVMVVVVALRPSDFRVSRSITISAPPEVVFPQVNDFHRWEAWSPWAKLDPNAKNSFSGPDAGVGAAFAWSGNNQVGAGRMNITESRPGELILINLEFERPMKGTNLTEFTFRPDGNQTIVTWTMTGKNNFMAKAFSLFVNCDKMVGGQFEKGLSQMKSLSEATAKK